MTTLILTPTLAGNDGLSCLARQFVAAFASIDGHRLDVLSLANASSSAFRWPSHVSIIDVRGNRPEFVWRAWQAARGDSVPDVVVVLHAHLLPAAWPLVRRGAALWPVLVGVESWRPLSWLQRRMLMQAQRAVAISHHTVREFRRANPAFASLPVDVCWPATPSLPAPEGKARTRPFALIVGRMSSEERYKGHDLLVEVWPAILRALPDAQLVAAGSGDDEARLRHRAAAAGLANNIEFVGSPSATALAALYRDCAFLVMPSSREGFGLVFLEAMAAGRACIGGRGAAEEIIVSGTTGLIVDPERQDDVRSALTTLFQQPDLAARFGEAGRRRARDLFSADRFTRELLEYMGAVMSSQTAAAC
jgi:phosphatidylinositol alpha-1,6-mannosyltransferase